ncbi:helicase-associated domain-containing protein [Paenibacillus borealis]|uniref:Helicase XPB/Ssl2 N-terminal domain-containing protein n=1 Tax=Paenibacillus borealis TaxID=160799 RepID=A0A089LDK2_PAEBO|nr:helicase-associated domain-containing protein [Paenibacillus borealis]AIQ58185.1 hypothetical protein PBOR_15545 [Paenibacillus borealis]
MTGQESDADVQKLTREAQAVLRAISAEHAASPVAADTIERLRPVYLCRAEQELALNELLQAGMLELRQKMWGEKLYQIPQHRFPLIGRGFWPACPQTIAETGVRIELPACTGLAAELFRALLFTAREGLPLTAKGLIHKRQLSQLAGQLSMQEVHLAGLKLNPAIPEPYPLPVTVIVDLMAVLGLISRSRSGYRIDIMKLQCWLALSEQEMTDTLYRIVISRYGSPEPAGQHFRHLISAAEFTPGEWFAVLPLLEWMIQSGLAKEQSDAGPAGSELHASSLAWLRSLAGFGWGELGYSKKGEPCFRWKPGRPQLAGTAAGIIEADESRDDICTELADETQQDEACGGSAVTDGWRVQEQEQEYNHNQKQIASGSSLDSEETGADWSMPAESGVPAAGRFVVQPDFEVLVPPEVPYTTRWTLAGYAELMHNEDLWSFRLTREMLEAAAELGCSPADAIEWLAAHAREGLPEQVELSLRQWAKGIGRTSLSEVILLSCAGEREGQDIAAHPRMQDILTRIGPLHFIVRPESVGQLRKELAAAGLAPPRIIGGREDELEPHNPFGPYELPEAIVRYELPSPAEERGLFGPAAYPKLLPLAGTVPDGELLQGEEAVPQMWFNQWRQYHVTTAQKVMEQALAWGIKVRISVKGQTADFIPEQISGRPWRVRGNLLRSGSETAEEIQLAAEDWQEMKLLHPVKQRNSSSSGAAGYVMIR